MTTNDLKTWIRNYAAGYETQAATAKGAMREQINPQQTAAPGQQWAASEYLIDHGETLIRAETRATELKALTTRILSYVSVGGMLDEFEECVNEIKVRADGLWNDVGSRELSEFAAAVRQAQYNATSEVLNIDVMLLRKQIKAYL